MTAFMNTIKQGAIGNFIGNLVVNPIIAYLLNKNLSVILVEPASLLFDLVLTAFLVSAIVFPLSWTGPYKKVKAGTLSVDVSSIPLVTYASKLSKNIWISAIQVGILMIPTAFIMYLLLMPFGSLSVLTYAAMKGVYCAVVAVIVTYGAAPFIAAKV